MLHEPVLADWARLGKLPGDREDYRILARSRGDIDVREIACQYVAGVPNTDAPKDAPWGPPWVTFGAHQMTDGRPVISVSVQYPWEELDGAGRPIWPQGFFACRYEDMARGGVSYQTLYAAIEHFKLPSDTQCPGL